MAQQVLRAQQDNVEKVAKMEDMVPKVIQVPKVNKVPQV
jgi:hypothetical protein